MEMDFADRPRSHEQHEHDHDHPETDKTHVTVLVNEHPVHFHRHTATGAEIKAEAIRQGVHIKEDFILHEELPDGGSRIVSNDEEVHLRHHLRFVAKPEKHEVIVSVNEQPVKLRGKTATGAEIKAEAIKQGVHIKPNFVLQEELPNGMSRIIGDFDVVHLREHLRFTAIAPDDNS
jgi:hypothetical protein